jgi:ABC-2 type transport system ATP-binding protein/lipopolysaccharide transport system ATP-binding protein
MSSDIAIELKNVWKKYSMDEVFHRSIREDFIKLFKYGKKNEGAIKSDEFWALKDINLQIFRNECVGFYGPNGSGKTTVLKLISNITHPTQGDISVKGNVAPLIEVGAGFHPDLTGRENIYINASIIGMKLKEIKSKIDEMIAFSELDKFIDMPIKKYSSGMYLRLGFSIAIHSSAEILLFDEILSVSDESFQKKCFKKINDLKREGRSIVMVSHDKMLLKELSDRVFLFKDNTSVIADKSAL